MWCNTDMAFNIVHDDGSLGSGGHLDNDLWFASAESEGPSDGLELYLSPLDAGIDDETLPPILSELFGVGLAQTRVTNMVYPYSTVVHIEVLFPNGAHEHGSGVMVGRNDVLTAGHLLYNPQLGGLAVSAHVIPFYNPAQPDARPWGEAFAMQSLGQITIDPDFPEVGVHAYPFPRDIGAGYYGSEIDYGFLTLDRALGDRTDTMSLDDTFTQGNLYQTGYPHKHGDFLTQSFAYASESTVYNLIDIREFESWRGDSGENCFRMMV